MKFPSPFLVCFLRFLLKRAPQSAHSGFLEGRTCSLPKNDIGRIDLMSLKTTFFTCLEKNLKKFTRHHGMRTWMEITPPWPLPRPRKECFDRLDRGPERIE
jgi:hypothetical protein